MHSKIGFIGLGKLGKDCAEVIAENPQNHVYGYDINPPANIENVTVVDSIKDLATVCDLVFVAVPTPHDVQYGGEQQSSHLTPKDFDYTIVKKVLKEADKYMRPTQQLVLVSTVLPGTIRSQFAPLVKNAVLIYNPYLIAMGSVKWDMKHPEMIMIGTGNSTTPTARLRLLYRDITQNDDLRIIAGTWEECEAIKVFYNTFISVKLSLVNMIQDVAMKLGNMNVDIVTDALKHSDKRIMGPQYMTAGMGDGGACHPRDNIALRHLSDELELGYDIFDTVIHSREEQARNLALFLVDKAKENDMPIVIHGVAYKPGVPYTDGSYSLLIASFCKEFGYPVDLVDPLAGYDYQPDKPSVFLLAHDADTTYQYTGEKITDDIGFYCDIPNGSVLVDPWRKTLHTECEVIHYGNTRNT